MLPALKRRLPLTEPMSLEQFEFVVRVNLIGSFNMLRLAAAAMAPRPRAPL